MRVAAGVRIGAFEVRAHIGAGGMGTVYRAHDTRLGRDVAIKVLQEDFADRSDYLRRIEREARAASALNHPNIITVFEIAEFEGAPFIAMEFVDGKRLRDVLVPGALPTRKLLKIATQIADGLAAAHERGIVHRDIKPENVMINTKGLVKILDFGLARSGRAIGADETTDEVTQEHDRRVVGTAAYMSPEQAAGKEVDFRSDQFSFGVVLYEMATGKRAFRRETAAETIDAIIREEPQPIRTVNPTIPLPLAWIAERCLSKDPQERYASTTDLAREMQTLRDRLPDTGSGDRLLPSLRGSPRRIAIAASAGIAALAVAGLLATRMYLRHPLPPLAGPQYVAVLPFKDVTGGADAQLFSRGFAEAVSAKLAKFSIQVIPPTASSALVAEKADAARISRELGATLLLDASLQRTGDRLRVSYSLVDPARGVAVAGDTVDGKVDDMWSIQDEVAEAIAERLGMGQTKPPVISGQGILETAEEQDLYLRALGNLQNHQDEKALDTALGQLRQLLETASDSALVHAALSRVYIQKYNLTRDRELIQKAVAAGNRGRITAPDSPEVLLALAAAEFMTGRYEDAADTYRRALAKQPNSAEAVIGLAKAYQGAGNVEEAEKTFRRGIALRPWWSGHNELGVFYLTRGRFDDAANEFARVIEMNPENAWGYSNAGAAYIFREKLNDAVTVLTKAIALKPDNGGAHANLAYCYYYLNAFDKSAEASRRATVLQPRVAVNWSNLADACRWSSSCREDVVASTDKAIALLRDDLKVNPKNARAQALLALVLARVGERNEARQHIEEALRLEPKNPTRMYQAARVANLDGNTSQAVSWLRRAVDAGQSRLEIDRDPDFRALRESKQFRAAFPANPRTS